MSGFNDSTPVGVWLLSLIHIWKGNYSGWLDQKTTRMAMEEKQESKRRKTCLLYTSRGDRGVGRRAAYPLVHPAGRLGRVVALVDRRAVRAARTCGEGMVPGQSEPEEEIGRCACLPPSRS